MSKKILSKNIIVGFMHKITEKKELHHLDKDFIVAKINTFLQKNPKYVKKFESITNFSQIKKAKFVDDIVKFVRKEARSVYGLYMTKKITQTKQYLLALKKAKATKNKEKMQMIHKKLLEIHLSTKERLHLYPKIYNDLFAITGKPKKILDLGCGFNGISLFFSNIQDISYVGCEFNQKDVDFLNDYFKIMKLKNQAKKLDVLQNPEKIKQFRSDVVFIFKLFDILPPKINEMILKNLKTKWIVVSFPLKTVAKKHMNVKRRGGFQKMLRRLGYSYQTLTYENEIFYIFRQKT